MGISCSFETKAPHPFNRHCTFVFYHFLLQSPLLIVKNVRNVVLLLGALTVLLAVCYHYVANVLNTTQSATMENVAGIVAPRDLMIRHLLMETTAPSSEIIIELIMD